MQKAEGQETTLPEGRSSEAVNWYQLMSIRFGSAVCSSLALIWLRQHRSVSRASELNPPDGLRGRPNPGRGLTQTITFRPLAPHAFFLKLLLLGLAEVAEAGPLLLGPACVVAGGRGGGGRGGGS